MRKNKGSIVVAVVTSACSVVIACITSLYFLSNTASATEITNDTIVMQKTLVNAASWCYEKGLSGGNVFNSPINTSDYYGVSSAINAWGEITVPTNLGNSLNNSKINCQQVMIGVSNKLTGLLPMFSKSVYDGTSLDDLGYKNTSGSTSYSYKCMQFSYDRYDPPHYSADEHAVVRTYKTNSICLPVDSDNKVVISNSSEIKTDRNENVTSDFGSVALAYNPSTDSISYGLVGNDGQIGGSGFLPILAGVAAYLIVLMVKISILLLMKLKRVCKTTLHLVVQPSLTTYLLLSF